MTLALYGKSHRRQGLLVLLAFFAVLAATVSGAALRPGEDARAAIQAGTLGTPTGSCTTPASAKGSDDARASCASGQLVEATVTPPSVPGHASDISFRIGIEGRALSGVNKTLNVSISSDSKIGLATQSVTFPTSSESTLPIPDTGNCDNWGTTWTAADLAGLKVRAMSATNTALIDNITVEVCWGARTITSATLNGAPTANVAPGASVALIVNATTTGGESGMSGLSDDWACLTYQIEGSAAVAVNHPDNTSSGDFSHSQNFVAPAVPGTYDVTLRAFSDNGCTQRGSNAFVLTDALVVTGQQQLPQSYIDAQGANDEPGQKDLTRMSVDPANAPTSIVITWNWDELGTNGANTMDGCALFDTDNDGLANYSLCQTTQGTPATALATTLYSCNDSRSDRCAGSSAVPKTSTCSVAQSATDPFAAGDSNPNDTRATCTVNLADVGASAAALLDVCSYPSEQPNSDPSDCVLAATGGVSRVVRVMKVTGSANHPAADFSGTISPGGDTSFAVSLAANGAVSAADDNIVSDQAQTVTETTLPADWANAGYYVQAASGSTLYTCTGSETYSSAGGSAAVPPGNGGYTVCIMNTYTAPGRTLRVMKVTTSATHPAETFVGTISPGAKSAFSVSLAQDAVVSAADSGTVSTAAQTVTETPLPGAWLQAGYFVHEDTSGPYACSGAESYTNPGGSATVPANTSNYTVCVKNTYSPATIVVHKEIGSGAFASPPATWNFSLSGTSTSTTTVPVAGGTSSFASLQPGTYTVTETNGATTGCASSSPAGSFWTTHGTAPNPVAIGTAESGISVAAGETKHVYFRNTPCPGFLGIGKTSSPQDFVAAGGAATWTITVNVLVNPTTSAWTVTDTLPAGFVVSAPGISDDSASLSCTPTAAGTTSFTCTLAANAPVGVHTITVPVTAPPNFPVDNCAAYTNNATISGGSGSVLVNSTATDSLTVTGCVDPSIALSKSNDLAGPLVSAGAFNWKVKATVTSGPTVADATISDTLPAGFSFNGTITFTGSQDASKLSCLAPVGQAVSCTLASGAANGDYFLIIPAKAPTVSSSTQCGNYTNSATASFPANQGTVTGSPATNQVTITCPSLTIAKTANPVGPVNLGSPIGFDLTISNAATVAATGVSVSDTLPSVAGVVWSTGTAGCGVSGDQLACTGLTVPANGGIFVVHVSGSTGGATTRAACGPITNDSATAAVIGVTSTSGSASVTVNCPNITLAKVANPGGPVNAGANIGWTFTVTNTTAVTANGVSVSDTLPSTTGVSWSPTATTTSGTGSCGVVAGVLTCTGLTVPASGSISIAVAGTTTASGANKTCGVIENTGAVATLLGTNSNQLTPASVTVNCPDPSVSKGGNGPVTAGDNVVFTVTVTAGGTGTQSVVLTDVMPGSGLNWTKGGANAADCTPAGPLNSGSMYTCTFNNLTPGDTRTVTFTAASTAAMCAAGPLQNTANIAAAADSVDTNGANNTASASNTVNCPNVTLTKVADTPTTVSAGDSIGFTITATNSGSGIARGFSLTDNLPANVNWSISPANPNCTISTGVLKCPGAGTTDLAANGGSLSVHIVGSTTAASCGTVSNTASAVVSNQANAIPNASAQVTVNCPDLVVLKTADNGTISAGDTAAFTLVVTNNGAGTAKDVTFTDVLPAGITWSDDSPNCTITGSLDCAWPSIAAGGSQTVHVTGLTAKANCGLLHNSVVVGASNESNTGNNTSTANIAVNCAEISVLKTPDASPVNATDNVGYTITAKNNGAGAAFGVTVTDALPAASGLNWSESPDSADCTISGGTLTCNFGTLASGASKSVHISSPTTVGTCGTLDNTALVSTTNDGSGQSAASIVVNCPNVTISKTKAPGQADPVSAGSTISFQIQVTVSGAGTAYNVTASDTFPPNTSQWSVTNDPSASSACAVVVGQLSCNFGNVTSPKAFTITVTGKAVGANGSVTCGMLTNSATGTAGNESNTSDNTSTASVGVNCPNVGIAKSASNSPVNAGDIAEFVITATNNGVGTATAVVVSDTLPTSGNLTWALDPAVPGCGIVAGVLSCSLDSLAAGASVEVHVSAKTNPASCGVLTNYAYASAANDNVAGPTQSNLAMITVNCPDLSLAKTAANSPVNAGDNASFTLTVKNASTSGAAYGVMLQDQLPPVAIGWTDDSADCSIDPNGLLSCTVGSLAPQGTFSVTVSGQTTPAQCGALSNSATTSATNEAASAFANNTASASITVNCPDIHVVKTPDGAGINAGDEAAFTMVVSNTGTGDAYKVTLTDMLPGGLSWTDDSDACDINAGVLNCAWDSISAGASANVTVSAPSGAAQCGELENTASAGAPNESESAGGNNRDSGSIAVACPDIDVVKTAVNDSINPGEDAAFAIAISNAGPGTAYGIVLTDVLPAGLTWTVDNDSNCEIVSNTLTCQWKALPAGQHLDVGLSAPTTTAQCGTLTNSASITVLNEAESLSEDNTSSDTVLVACGSIQVIKIDSVAANDSDRPADWDFTITGPNGFNESRSIALGGGSATIPSVPLGSGYAVSEVQAKFGACPVPNEAGTYRTTANNGPQNLTEAGQTISFSFNNEECGALASTGILVINKVSDINGNHVQDAGEIGLAGWPVTVTGPEFPSGQQFVTGANGQLVLPGIKTGPYTVAEGSQAGYQAIGVVTDDNGPVFSAGTSTGITLDFGDTDVVTFFNQPLGGILVNKTTQVLVNSAAESHPQDRSGWRITVVSAACGVSLAVTTDATGNALFAGLPLCTDYVVAEDLSVPAAPGYTPAGPASVANVTPSSPTATRVSFVNQRVVTLCTNCSTQPSPTPTATPPAATATPTSTPTSSPPTPTITLTPVSTQAGERTPGPGSPTPIAPSTGGGWTSGPVTGGNLVLVIAGVFAVAGGLVFLGLGRKRR